MFVKEWVLKRWRLDSEMSQSGSSSSPRRTPPPLSPPSYFSRLLSGGLFMAAVCARFRCRSSWRRECVKFVYSDSVSLPAFCSPSPVSTQIANRLSKSRLKRERNFYVLSGEKRRGWEDRREEQKAAPRGASPPLLCITVAGMCERTWAKPRWNQPGRARLRHARVWLKLKQSSLGTSCTITPLIKRLPRPWWSFDLELLGLLLFLLTSCLPFSPFFCNLSSRYVIDVLKARAALYFAYIHFRWWNRRVWISCSTWTWSPNGLSDMCLWVFVNLYLAYLEEPPANAAANGWSNHCRKWNCRILFSQREKIKTAAFRWLAMGAWVIHPAAWWIFQTWISRVCRSFIFSPNGFRSLQKWLWCQQLHFFVVWGATDWWESQKKSLSISISLRWWRGRLRHMDWVNHLNVIEKYSN